MNPRSVFISRQMFPISGTTSEQIQNNAGGFVFTISCWERLKRFLILGAESNTYYVTQKELTLDNANSILECLEKDGMRTVREIVEISQSGRAPKNSPAILALSLAASMGNEETKKAALNSIPKVCRTGTHLFEFAQRIQAMRGWGRSLRRAIAHWYTEKQPQNLVYQVIKYQQRNEWSHLDLLRLSHPVTENQDTYKIFQWITRKQFDMNENSQALSQLKGFILSHQAKTEGEVVDCILKYRLPREAVLTEWLKYPSVWKALLPHMPINAMVRNLANMTQLGVLTDSCPETNFVISRLSNSTLIQKSRLHPIQILSALLTYQAGHGKLGHKSWTPLQSLCNTLDQAFYKSFKNVEPTNKRIVLALDVSGSMNGGNVAGVEGLTPKLASAALAMVTARVEEQCHILGFSHQLVPIPIQKDDDLSTVVSKMNEIEMGATDCSLPMLWAFNSKVKCDAFVIYTDSETWCGNVHPNLALKEYRRLIKIPAKLIVVGMVSNGFSIADPNDSNSMDIVGFDTGTPQLIQNFIADGLDKPLPPQEEESDFST